MSMPATIIVGQAQMDFIRQRTQQVVPATNGPGDGPPKYAVPVELYQQVFGSIDHRLVMSETESHAPENIHLHPEASRAPSLAPSRAPTPAPIFDDSALAQTHKTQTSQARKRRTEAQAHVIPMGSSSRATRASTRASARELRSHRNMAKKRQK